MDIHIFVSHCNYGDILREKSCLSFRPLTTESNIDNLKGTVAITSATTFLGLPYVIKHKHTHTLRTEI